MVDVIINGDRIKDIELFVFDKDGTLMELYAYWSSMIAMRAEGICSFYGLDPLLHKDNLMGEMGVDIACGRLKPEGPVGLFPRGVVQKAAEEYLAGNVNGNVSDVCFQIFEEVDELSLSSFKEFTKPIEGAVELLEKIKGCGCKVAVATSDRAGRAEIAMEFLGMKGQVDFIVGADKVKESKPAPEMLELIGQGLGVPPERSVMVGDAETDIKMGVNAGFKASIGVCSGLTDREVLLSLTPHVVRDVSKICLCDRKF